MNQLHILIIVIHASDPFQYLVSDLLHKHKMDPLANVLGSSDPNYGVDVLIGQSISY